ncbi:alpha-1,2-fucosyltransferase [Desulfovibrio piger]
MHKIVTMRTLGDNGRFANQVFQYSFLYFYTKKYKMELQTPHWIGEELFGFKNNPICRDFARIIINKKSELDQICQFEPIGDIDFWGYFQDILYYIDYKDEFQKLFTPIEKIKSPLTNQWSSLLSKDIIGLHLRYGDYGYGHFYETPLDVVLEKIEERWEHFQSPVLYIATDDLRVCKKFKKFSPLTSRDIFSNIPCPSFYLDFWALSNINKTLITSNSSFSFAAAMLNMYNPEMFRPSILQKRLIPFFPWNPETPVLLNESTKLLDFFRRHLMIARIYNKIRRLILFNF